MKPRPPANPQTLDELLLMAADFAEFTLRRGGQVPPTLIVATQKRPLIFTPDSFRDDRGKDEFAETCRWICIAHEATAAVLILESWMKFATPEQPLDMNERPSEALDRVEVVFLAGEAIGVHRPRILKIIRTDVGGFFGLTEIDDVPANSFEGRFAELMPPVKPDSKMVAVARALLGAKGVDEKRLGSGRRGAG